MPAIKLIATIIILSWYVNVSACKPGEVAPGVNSEMVGVVCSPEFEDAAVRLKNNFEKSHPGILVFVESFGGRELGYVLKDRTGKIRTDIVLTTDPDVIEEFLRPGLVDGYIIFGGDELCLAFSSKSSINGRITGENWERVIVNSGIRVGRVDENLDPLGYRTLLCWKLADRYFGRDLYGALFTMCSRERAYPNGALLVKSLQNNDIDCAFVYMSTALTCGLTYVRLCPEINLGDTGMSSLYKSVSVTVSGASRDKRKHIAGKPIVFAAAFVRTSESKSNPGKFFEYLFSPEAKAVFKEKGIEFKKSSCVSMTEKFKDLCGSH